MFKRKKIRIGIDINEILRAKWSSFDRFFCQEFGEDGIPEQQYVYDYYKEYPWKNSIEVVKELKEPEDIPDDINPIDYQTDENGVAPVDFLLFKKEEKKSLTPREVYNRFMYEDFVFEIFALAPLIYRGADLDIKNFYFKYKDYVEFTLLSIENEFSIPSTLSFLSRITSRFNNYRFVDKATEMWENIDILITTDPEILNKKIPWYKKLIGKKLIKIIRPYNLKIDAGLMKALQIHDLDGNEEFEKIIRYKNKVK